MMDPLSACWNSLDTARWYIYHFRSRPRETWQNALQRLFETIQNCPIDLRITNTTLTLFRNDDPRPIANAPKYVKRLHKFLVSKPHRFQTVHKDPTRKTFAYSNYIRGVGRIDRDMWAEWIVAGLYQMAPTHRYLLTDMFIIALRGRTFHASRKRPPPHPLNYLFNTPKKKQWKRGTAPPSSSGASLLRGRSLSEATGRDIYGRLLSMQTHGTDSPHTLLLFRIRDVSTFGTQNSYSPVSPSYSP